MLKLFRVLLPSYRFFDCTTDALELLYRTSTERQDSFGPWALCIPKPGPRKLKNLFLNHEENFLFACHALLEYFQNDLNDGIEEGIEEDIAESTSFRLVQNLVRFQIKKLNPEARIYQFSLGYTMDPSDALYTSIVLEVSL
jgi:hypothetical protein